MVSTIAVAEENPQVIKARQGVAALGKQWNGEVIVETARLYADVHRTVNDSGLKQYPNLSYGPHQLQNFDLFVSENHANRSGPVLIYLHGGGLIRGDKISSNTDGLMNSNVAKFAARMGGVGINANYRLTPEVQFPAGAEDIKLLLQWVRENIAEYGGNPDNVFLMGNSAGSTHVATYLFREASQFDNGSQINGSQMIGSQINGPQIRGAILASGAFRADDDSARVAYYGEDKALRRQRDPLALVDTYEGRPVPLFLFSAEFDPLEIELSVAEMYAKLCRKYEDCPMFAQFQGHNHASHVYSIDSADNEVAMAISEFIQSVMRDD